MKTFTTMAEEWLLKRNIDQRASQSAESTSSVEPLERVDFNKQFRRWALAHCEYNARWSTSIEALYRDFEQWFDQKDQIPPDKSAFEALVREEGFSVADGLVNGLTLSVDVRSLDTSAYEVGAK